MQSGSRKDKNVMRYSIRLSYNGLSLNGWQRQDNAPSVQEELSKALSTLLGSSTDVTGAGRTDARVNAVNYIAHFDTPNTVPIDATRLVYKINAILPKNIAVHEILPSPDGFHARFSAISREYHYFIHLGKDPFMESFSYRCRCPIDMERMNSAARHLLGTHDFSCFEKKGSDNRTSVCTVYEAIWETYVPAHVTVMGFPCHSGDYMVFRIRADRFLRNMVRAIVGSLVDVGRGKREPEWIAELMTSGSRGDAGGSVPGHAFFLSEVRY